MKKIVFMVVMLAITLFVVVSPVNAEGLKRVVSTKGAFGCVHKDYHQNLVETLVNGDKEAFVKGLLTAYQSGECLRLQQGTVVFVTDTAIWAGLSRVRPEGSMDEYWTSYENAMGQ
ncbi:hypothetical protein [Microcoleus sp.]|jgi:dUTPase|uniref:hypothetical protein n=1 Tax=Microcoleus sp. TaxID=44472 RepID=UPI00403EBDB0